MKFVNDSDTAVYIAIGKGVTVPARGYYECQEAYAKPRRADNGDRFPSVIEMLAPQLKPADPSDLVEWKKAPPPVSRAPQAAQLPTVEGLMSLGLPRQVAEAQIRQIHQAALDALSAKSEEAAEEEFKPKASKEKR